MIFKKFLQNNKWQHKDPAVRLEAISELSQASDLTDTDAGAAAQIVGDLARTDSDIAVRQAAIAQLRSPDTLQTLMTDTNPSIQQAAVAQYCRVVSGAMPSALSVQERGKLLEATTEQGHLLAVTMDCGCDETGLTALSRLQQKFSTDASRLYDIASGSSNHTIRHAAAVAITDTEVLEKLAAQMRQKDKGVYKVCKDKLQVVHDAQAQCLADETLAIDICAALESLSNKVIGALSQAQLEYKLGQWQEVSAVADAALVQRFSAARETLDTKINEYATTQQQLALQQQQFESLTAACESLDATITALGTPLTVEQIETVELQVHALRALSRDRSNQSNESESPDVLKRCKTLIKTGEHIVSAFHALEAKRADIDLVKTEISELTAKGTSRIVKATRELHKLFDKDSWPKALPHSELFADCLAMEQQIAQLQERNKAYQDKLHKDSLANIAALEVHVEQGQVNEAQRLWDKVQGAIKNSDDNQKRELQEKVAPYTAKIKELMDWKNFAATEKKKELIEHMQALVDGKMHAADRAKRIKALQDEWKKLGHSLHNDSLWTQFNELSHTAFEPCREYFKERKAKLHTNLEERNKICAQLEELVPTLTAESLNMASLNKIESKAQEDWKLYAPVEQAKIKKLQKRFNTALSALRQFKRKSLQANAAQKLELIAQAEQLDNLESVQDAMSEAKKLQAQWKSISPSPYKDDRNHWNAFRAACDKVFTKRSNEPASKTSSSGARSAGGSGRQTTAANPAVAVSRDALRQISDLLNLGNEELVQSRKQFNDLKDAFMATLTPELKHEKRALQEQFERVSKDYENRLRAAPDKKSLQLIGQVKVKAEFCEKLEQDMLSGKGAPDDIDAVTEQWEALGKVPDLMQEQALEQRFHALTHGVEARQFKKQAKDNELKAKEICIAAEIHAGMDSPASDKALRMQVQLQQLKSSFGSRGNKSPAQLVSDLEMQLMCLGPLESATRKSCESRILQAKAKL